MGYAIWTNKCPSHIYDFDELLVSKALGKVCASVYEWYFGLFQIQNRTLGTKSKTEKKNLWIEFFFPRFLFQY
jgi:hypothetical protein